MARSPRYSSVIGIALLVIGFVVGAGAAWAIVPGLVAPKPKPPAPTSTVKRAPGDAARTVQLVDQAVAPAAKAAKVEAQAPKAQPDVVEAAHPEVVDAAGADAAPVPPEKQIDIPEFKRLDRPFPMKCPAVLNRYDRAGARFESVAVDAFCADLRGRFHVVVFWRSEAESDNPALKLFQDNAAALAGGTPPVDVVFVSSDRFPSDLKAFFEAEGAAWTFQTYQGLVDGWLTNYGSQNPDRSFPWLVAIDPDRMVLFEGPAMATAPDLMGFRKLLADVAAARADVARAAESKKPDAPANGDKGGEPRKDKLVDPASKKSAPVAGGGGGRREIDYVTLGLQVMRLFPDLAGTPELRQVVKISEQSLNARLKKMSPGEANRVAANPPDAMVRDAVKAALKSLGK